MVSSFPPPQAAHLMPWRTYLLKRPSTMPCTPPRRMQRSPYMSLLYSLSRVVAAARTESW